ncbi:hypothetical protein RF11_02654 [Thelohanellus kitauei]|uniref:Uncharacterized protein n=1 Tax=Thelohanellus kitauei TaxID=669202 RepID=A0A0C2ITB4_THEKT|nr:hypothetical protein RF11_02654 [Thelohanellus kitauei]
MDSVIKVLFIFSGFMTDRQLIPIFRYQIYEITCMLFGKVLNCNIEINVVTVFEYDRIVINRFFEKHEQYFHGNKITIVEEMDMGYLNECIQHNISIRDVSPHF